MLTQGNLFYLYFEKGIKLMRKVKTNVILYFKKLGVRLVNNYADTDITTQTLLKTFEGFSQILKEQSGKKRYLGVFTKTI